MADSLIGKLGTHHTACPMISQAQPSSGLDCSSIFKEPLAPKLLVPI